MLAIWQYRTIESWIHALIAESKDNHAHMGYYRDQLNDQWGEVLTIGNYADNLSSSNWDTISAMMESRYPRETQIICPVFKCSGIWVKLLTKRGKATQAAQHIYDVLYKLESDYCVYDQSDLLEREYDQQIESIENTLGGYTIDSLPEDYAKQVFSYLWDNDQESIITEDKSYCDDLGVFTAALELGYLDDSDPDEFPIPSYVMRQINSWIAGGFNKPNRF